MIDLQSHSTVSDGQLPPADVVRSAAGAGIATMALTDHDGVAGVPEALATAEHVGIECIPAVEMSCVHRYSEDLHICGYWVDTDRIQPACDRAQQERVDRAKEIIANLNAHGVGVTFEDAVAQAGAADAIGRPHIAKAAGAGPTSGRSSRSTSCPARKRSFRAGGRAPRRRSGSSMTRGAWPSSPTRTGTCPSPSRSATWSRASSATCRSTGSRPSTRRTPPSRPALPGTLRRVRPGAHGLVRLPRTDPQDVQPLGRLRHLRPRRAPGSGQAKLAGPGINLAP